MNAGCAICRRAHARRDHRHGDHEQQRDGAPYRTLRSPYVHPLHDLISTRDRTREPGESTSPQRNAVDWAGDRIREELTVAGSRLSLASSSVTIWSCSAGPRRAARGSTHHHGVPTGPPGPNRQMSLSAAPAPGGDVVSATSNDAEMVKCRRLGATGPAALHLIGAQAV